MQKEAEIKRRRQSNIYSKLSQFSRLSRSPSNSPNHLQHHHHHHLHHKQIWKPSFTFHFTAVSVFKRFYRRIKYFFIKQPQTLPYYNPTIKTPKSTNSNSLLTFLSRDDTNLYSDNNNINTPRNNILTNWMSYYWHRILSKKQAKELD